MKYNKLFLIGTLGLALCCGSMQSCGHSANSSEHSEKVHDDSEGEDEDGHGEGEKEFAEITQKQMQTVGIVVAPLEYKALDESIRANGSLVLPKSYKAQISALYGGQIKRLLVHSGDKVKKGQVVAYISSPEVIQLQEEYWRAKTSLDLAKSDFERQTKLKQSGGSSEKKYLSAKGEYISLNARLKSLSTKLSLVGLNPKTMQDGAVQSTIALRSPLSGVISAVNSSIGVYLDASSPLAEVIDNSGLHLELNVYEQDLSKVRLGQTIHFTLTNAPRREYDAKVYSIGASFSQDSHTILVHCHLDRIEPNFIDGMNITGLVSAGGGKPLPVLPEEAIVHNDGKDYAYMFVPAEEVEHTEESSEHKEAEAHQHEEDEHKHKEEKKHKAEEGILHFKAVELVRGTTELGFTAVHFIGDIPKDARFVQRGAFFVAAELSEPAGHHH